MSFVLDAGAFVAVERGERDVIATLEAARRNGIELRTTAIVVGQIWRTGTGRQAPVARLLSATDVIPVDENLGKSAGALLARAGTADPIDATVVLIAAPRDTILTSDPRDITLLLRASGSSATVDRC